VAASVPDDEVDSHLYREYRAWAACTGALLTRHRLDGTLVYCSAASHAVLGWGPEEIVGKKLGEFLHPDDARIMVSEHGQVPSDVRPRTATFRLLRKDGTHVWVEATGAITKKTDESPPEIIAILREVSDRPSIDNQLRRAWDSGVGISEEDLPRVFDLFFRARWHGAAGIGLSLVRSVVEMHGGSVEARSDGVGRGSEFIVKLPTLAEYAREDEAVEVEPRAEPEALRSHRVLVVDDDPAVADGFAMLLESMGQEVHVVHGGNSAVDATVRIDPSIVFIDLSMPGMDGYETARRIRGLPGVKPCRLVALSGYGLATVESRIRDAGFDGYVAKPARPEDLEEIFA
jgi:PAS domain S-box-containing protein